MADSVNLPEPSAPAVIFSHGHYAAKQAQHPYRTFLRQVVSPHFDVFYYLFALVALVQVTPIISPILGVYTSFIALALAIVIAMKYQAARGVAIGTAIIPLAMIATFCLPQDSAFATMVVFYDAMLILAMAYRFIFATSVTQGEQRESLGLSGYLKTLPTMLILGQLIGSIAYLALRHQYQFGGTSFGIVALTAAVFAVAEESLFRGLIQKQGATYFHPVMAAALPALFMGTLSLGTGNWLSAGIGLLTGAVLSYVYYVKKNVVLTIVLNYTAKLVYLLLLADLSWNYFHL